jgi:hypothetical protein
MEVTALLKPVPRLVSVTEKPLPEKDGINGLSTKAADPNSTN